MSRVRRTAVLRSGRLAFVTRQLLADGVRNGIRRVRGPGAPVESIGGIAFRRPALRPIEMGSYYRARVLRLRYRSPDVAWPFPRVVGGPDPLTLRAPLVLATFHLGPLPGARRVRAASPGPGRGADEHLGGAAAPRDAARRGGLGGTAGRRVHGSGADSEGRWIRVARGRRIRHGAGAGESV